MLGTNQALGRFIVLAYQEQGVISNTSITKNIEDLVDIIKLRLQEKDIETVGDSVLEKIFEVRFALLNWFVQQNKSIEDYQVAMNQVIARKLQLASFSEMAETVALILSLQEKIARPIASTLNKGQLNQAIYEMSEHKISYDFVQLFSMHPAPRVQYLKKWIDASLELEFGLIVADLALREELYLSKKQYKSLISYLENTITRYGACSIFTGFWKPKEEEVYNSSWINQMEILNACWEVDHGLGESYSLEELSGLVNLYVL